MNLFGLMETSGSAMQAERMRAEVVAANMANAETTRTEDGGPYHRQHVIFAANASPASFANVLGDAASNTSSLSFLPLPTAAGQAPGGVRVTAVVADPGQPLKRYDPGHPDAGPDGYVSYPDINPLTEMVDLMGATRAYGLNGSAVQAEKGMISAALDIAKG
ncbi:MAG TPA: flagellar basal body rod protein FlgC [Terracidiphilus sp.]|jgi:flagellar basal-body rod protein FlgC